MSAPLIKYLITPPTAVAKTTQNYAEGEVRNITCGMQRAVLDSDVKIDIERQKYQYINKV